MFEFTAAVLLTDSRENLREMLSICNLLHEIHIILILPDREDGTVAKGHRLYPRFMGYIDGDFADIGIVLSNMLMKKGGLV
jgi:hypothetical protein